MGLCKCPKRQVTNQFCFEHRVNVCEHCMVQSHPKCIVQSYLQWLRDSDYVSNCTLCCTTLDNSDCVRLVCYHVFHWNCLNMRQASLSINTTPRGHICPSCDTEIFPTSNLVSPVADALKTYLSKVNWGRNGLGLALVVEDSVVCSSVSPGFANLKLKSNTNVAYPQKKPDIKHSVLLMDAFNPPSTGDAYASSRRPLLPRQSNIVSSDCDESKYKRRTPAEMFSRWSRRFYAPSTRPLRRRHLVVILVVILSFLVIVYIMTTLEQGSSTGITANEWINPNPVPNMHYE